MIQLMNKPLEITTQNELRKYFWHNMYPYYQKKKGYEQNDYATEVRVAWTDFVDMMEKNGVINHHLAFNVTLA